MVVRYSLRQLHVFRMVADHLSYTVAAERLHLSQPAVFAQVKQLEDQIGMPLFERIGRNLRVTEVGQVVLRGAKAMSAEGVRMEAELEALKGLSAGRLDLAVVSTAKYTLSWLIGPFSKAYPGIDIRLTVGNRRELLERFAANMDDLYVLGAVPPELAARHMQLAENPIIILAAPDHPLAGRTGLTLADIGSNPIIMREAGSGTRRAAEAQFAACGFEPNIRFELGANEAVKHAAMAGLGLAVLSRGTVQLELEYGHVVELEVEGFPLLRHWSLAWSPQRVLTTAAIALQENLRQASFYAKQMSASD